MKQAKITFILLTVAILVFSCNNNRTSKDKTLNQNITSIKLPSTNSDKGIIKNLESGCSYNEDSKGDEIEIYLADKKEIDVIQNITSFSGIPLNFKIYQADIENAVATIINNERFILYDKRLLDFADSETNSYWSSISILAHEIGHHLSGHTLKELEDSHKAELEADNFSGFVLYKMGASLDQATKAIKKLGSNVESASHPKKEDRIRAIKEGWEKAYNLDYKSAIPPPLSENPNDFYEYTMDMLYNQENLEFYSRISDGYDFMYGVITDSNLEDQMVENVVMEIIKTGKKWETNYGSLNGKRIKFNLDYGYGPNMCSACMRQLPELLKAGRRVKFAFDEGRPDGGSSLNGVFFLSYVKAVEQEEIDFYLRNSNNLGFKKVIEDFLLAEENRSFEKINQYYSSNLKRYWNTNYPTSKELYTQYQNAWSNTKFAQNIIQKIQIVNPTTYILYTNFRFFDLKAGTYKDIKSEVKFVFNKEGKIVEIYGV
ncbi:hypothetical protein JM83_3225 [Gillisia sp. Hel_I_86]|uniref:hypothetical protein n=1 Tax=Gillisia sp. Hel_I_86 TaxID=1249981 RepID=UPI00119AD1F2|nr:hypothetical protein [Gillisia sp. Hel_I_86]TVZ26584.1 hypothetical protein JM83_1560 [Gillisia sp. Hel_I_86]TVZ27907.1 hypothetical protein JM83_2985 [Gillisia sp. Hel_I_86]TVZ28121.1 hypothetical protein JM83_3225 [Gillisia sp. Hel_I_86]